jgi:hypothetical protein
MEKSNPDIFSRNSSGNVNRSHISPWVIQNKIFPSKNETKRSALEMYVQFLSMANNKLLRNNKNQINSIVLGTGQDGQLKFTNERDGKSDFCTAGDF